MATGPGAIFFTGPRTVAVYTLSLHDALPLWLRDARADAKRFRCGSGRPRRQEDERSQDRKSTRLNSSHANISYAVFRLKKKMMVAVGLRVHGACDVSVRVCPAGTGHPCTHVD